MIGRRLDQLPGLIMNLRHLRFEFLGTEFLKMTMNDHFIRNMSHRVEEFINLEVS